MRYEIFVLFTVAASLANEYAVALAVRRARRSSGTTDIVVDDRPVGTGTPVRFIRSVRSARSARRRREHVVSDTSPESAGSKHRKRVRPGDYITAPESNVRRRVFRVEQRRSETPKNNDYQTTIQTYDYAMHDDDDFMSLDFPATTIVNVNNKDDKYESDIIGKCGDSWTKYLPIIFVAFVLLVYPFLYYCCKPSKFNKDMIYLQLNNCHCCAKYCNPSLKR